MAEQKKLIVTCVESRHRAARDRVVAHARTISRSLARLADALEKDPTTPVNGLGELQGRAGIFDAYCSEYATLCSVLDDMEKCGDK